MFKLINKKLTGKKGFTLAELLVVISILAILIAIAIPVFSNMVAEANLRVNQANVHSVRSAAVTKILTNLDEHDDSKDDGTGPLLNKGLKDVGEEGVNKGWVAFAEVDNAGNVTNLKVWVLDGTGMKDTTKTGDGIWVGPYNSNLGLITTLLNQTTKDYLLSGDLRFASMPKDVDTTTKFAAIKPTTGNATFKKPTVYTVQVVITDLDLSATKPSTP